jgi:endosialidase-like protein
MKKLIQFKPFNLWAARLTHGRRALVAPYIGLALTAGFVLLAPVARAVSPAPDGGYPNGNTAEGNRALFSLTNGIWNTALGQQTLYHDTSGSANTGVGFGALFKSATAYANTATGVYALFSNATGYYNTADGFEALGSNATGVRNTAVGAYALYSHASGNYNNAVGVFALNSDTIGIANNAFGESALLSNTSGTDNTAIGDDALWENTTGSFNIALGSGAGRFLTTGSHNIDIGNVGVAGESNTIRIGSAFQDRTFITGVYGANEGGTISPVYINSNGQLGTQPRPSSKRFKKEIRPMDKSSESIVSLKPVTFHYKNDDTNTPQFGLVAEEVAEVNPDLVVRDENGEIYTVRYDAVNAMLLNEFLKEHKKVEQLEDIVAGLAATVKEQAVQIQRVSAQIEMSKPAPKVVVITP